MTNRPTAKSPTKIFQSVIECYERGNNILVHSGGTSSGKTYSIVQALFYIAAHFKLIVTITGQDRPNLSVGPYRDAQDIINSDSWINKRIADLNKARMTYTFTNGSVIEFDSRSDFQDAKQGKRDILFANEANGIPYDVFEEMNMRTSTLTIIDFNPTSYFWAHEKLQANPDTVWINTTFRDNPFIKESVKKGILSYEPTKENIERGTANKYRWQVYGLGQVGKLEGLVFPNFKTTSAWPNDYKWRVFGMDFGYTNDPTTLIEIRYSGGALYWCEHIYQVGMTNPDISKELERIGHERNEKIIADSAEPKSIEELKRLRWRVEPAEKGRDSVMHGIDALNRYPLYVHAKSRNLIEEFSSYTWKKDRDGKSMNEPVDKFNDGIDAGRYAVGRRILKPQTRGFA